MVIIPFVTHQKQLLANISIALMLNHLFSNDYDEGPASFYLCHIHHLFIFMHKIFRVDRY